MRTSLLLLSCALIITTKAQMVQKCCGTGNSTFLLGNLGTASHSQCIYAPSDLTGAQAGEINRLYYRYGTTGIASGNTLDDFMVRFTQTTATAFNNNLFFTGLDTAYMASSFVIPPGNTGNWFAVDLDSTFTYDETLTLIVDLSFTGSATTNFGTASTSMSGRKLYSGDNSSPTGQSVVSSWQDVGFDLIIPTSITEQEPEPFTIAQDATGTLARIIFSEPVEEPTIIQLFDVNGKMVLVGTVQPGMTATEVDLNTLSIGLYVLRASNANGTLHSKRLVKP